MPWRLLPQAAFAPGLLGAFGLVAAEGMLCADIAADAPLPPPETVGCVLVRSDRWNLLPGVEFTGRLKVDLAAGEGGGMTLVVGDALPLDIEAQALDGTPVPLGLERFRADEGLNAPPDFWLEFGNPWRAPPAIVQTVIDALPDRTRTVAVRLGRRAPRVMARLTGYSDNARARICALPVPVAPAFSSDDHLSITPVLSEYFATGWYGAETTSPGRDTVRWMNEHGALLVPSLGDGNVHVRLQASPASAVSASDGPTLTLTVNGVFVAEPRAMVEGPATYEWVVPDQHWVAATNELLFSVSRTLRPSDQGARDRRPLAMALQRLDLRLER